MMKKKSEFFVVVLMLVFTGMKPMLVAAQNNNGEMPLEHIKTEAKKEILVANEDGEEQILIQNGANRINVKKLRSQDSALENIVAMVVPLGFFILVLGLFLGRRYLMEKTHRRKIELLEKMVEKGQLVSDAVIQQIFCEDRLRQSKDSSLARTVRYGVTFTFIGVGLLIYSMLMHYTGQKLIVGIVLLGVGIGFLVSYRFEKKEISSSHNTQ